MKAISNPLIIALVFVGLIISLLGLSQLKTNADYRVYFDKSDPLLLKDNALADQYSHLDSLIVILEAKTDTLLAPELIPLYPLLEEQLNKIDHVERINGFFQFLENEDTFEAELDGTEDNASPAEFLQRLHDNPRAANLFTDKGQFGILNIGVQLPGINTAKEVKSFMADVKSVINNQLDGIDSITPHYSGTLALNEAYIDVVRHDLKRFVPALILIFLLCLFAFFRTWSICFLMIGTAFFSAVSAFGVAGWMGWELAAINAFTPIIIMSLNIATAMHIVVNYFRFFANGVSKSEAMVKSIQFNFKALTLSKLTTALGFLLLLFSPSPPVQVVGYTVAIGMLFSYVLCLSVLRIILPKLELSAEKAQRSIDRFSLRSLGHQVLKNTNKVIISSIVIILLSLSALTQLQVNDNVYEYFPEEHSFREGTELIDIHFDGSIRLFYSIESSSDFGILEPVYKEKLSTFTTWLSQQDGVTRVDDVFSQATKSGVNFDSIKSLLKTNTPKMLGLDQQLTQNYDATKVTVFLKNVTAREIIAFDKKANHWLNVNIPSIETVRGVGPDLLFARLGERNAKSMFFSLILALTVIALITGFLIRSFKAAFIGLVCNLFPVIVIFAVWVLVGGYISLGSAMVMGMIMGIIVDDTLHLLLKFPRNFNNNKDLNNEKDQSQNHDKEPSNSYAILSLFEKVSPAIVITSITLSAGLFVGVFSGFRPIYELSLLSLSIILIAMLADLFLLPALMKAMSFKRK